MLAALPWTGTGTLHQKHGRFPTRSLRASPLAGPLTMGTDLLSGRLGRGDLARR